MRWLTILLMIVAMLVSACGMNNRQEKIAVVDWAKVMEAHPKQTQLKAAQDAYDSLLFSRKNQVFAGKTQLTALARLQQLKQNSKQNYLSAEFNTRLAERETVENDQLNAAYKKAVEEAQNRMTADEKKQADNYKLQLFNLRLRYESLHLTLAEKQKIKAEIDQIEKARNAFRYRLVQRQQAEINRIMEPEREAARARMQAYADELHAQMQAENRKTIAQDASALDKTPEQFKDLLASVDKELDNRQQLVEKLQDSIKKDVESSVMKIARSRGYTVVFHKYRVNIKADDITQDVINDLKNKK
jgi:DNA repair exonuclease SbcCD ATPase subunit